MGWTAGADVSTGDLITAAQWNNYLGVAGSLEYLKTIVDSIDGYTQSQPANSLDTVYQNTTSVMRFITVYIQFSASDLAYIYSDAATPPTTVIDGFLLPATVAQTNASVQGIIPYNKYYKVYTGGTAPTLLEWTEVDIG